jgi:hypothetical protein
LLYTTTRDNRTGLVRDREKSLWHAGTGSRRHTVRYTPMMGSGNMCGCGVVKGPGSVSTPQISAVITIASCDLSCAASAAYLQAGAAKRCELLALQSAHMHDGYRLGARAVTSFSASTS